MTPLTPERPSQPPYVIGAEIASGGMARVHVGRRVGAAGFSRVVAIKRLHRHLCRDDEMVRSLVDEAHLAARVRHPNVVPVLDTFIDGGELCLVMEYVDGSALVALAPLKKGAPRVPVAIAIAIVVDALTGLHAAHESIGDDGAPLRLIHRDVSPQNILVGVDGVARVTDFGVAKAAGRLTETKQGGLKGKVAYMAPEQVAGSPLDRSVDVWAAGVVLWELLTGRRLFRGESEAAILEQVRVAMIDPPGRFVPELPQALDDLILRALDPDPAKRPRTALELANALLAVTPRASAEEVGAWVRSRASESIDERARSVAEIPSTASRAQAAGRAEGTTALDRRPRDRVGPRAPRPRHRRRDLPAATVARHTDRRSTRRAHADRVRADARSDPRDDADDRDRERVDAPFDARSERHTAPDDRAVADQIHASKQARA